MNTVKIFLSIVITSFLISSCSPEPVFRLQSEHQEDEILLYRGMEYLISQGNNSSVVMAYYRHIDHTVIMDLEIVNNSEEMIRVYPSAVTFKAYLTNGSVDKNAALFDDNVNLIAEGTVLDPEEVILNIDKQTSKEIAERRTDLALDGIITTMDLVADLSTIGNESAGSYNYRQNQRTMKAIDRAERREIFYQSVSTLNEQRAYWETEAFRASDLQPGESIAGEIRLPLVEKSRFIEINVHIEGEDHIFRYKQTKINP